MSGQSVMDRVIAAKHSIAGAGLAKSVCKASTEEIIGPKKKHLDYLVHCTNEPNVSIPQLADLLIERTQHTNWVVVFKSLISIHNLMNYGNERFSQYFASNNCSFNLGAFMDKGALHGYDMSTFIRRYSKYLNAKSYSYRTMAYDFCKVKRGKDDGLLRTMYAEKLLKSLPPLQTQLDALIEFDCTPNELTNGVINACFMLMFKDLIRLFACYNDGIINLLEKYFDMNKKQCKEALEIYKRFLVRMEKVSEFLKVAENVGIDKGDIPDLAKGMTENNAPSSLLEALEEHYEFLDNKKGIITTGPSAKPAGFASALNSMSGSSVPVSDEEKNKILMEETYQFEEFKKKKDIVLPQTAQQMSTNPFIDPAPQPPTSVVNNLDLFGAPTMVHPLTNGMKAKSSDDLLSLNTNPFQQNIQNAAPEFSSPWGSPAVDGSTNAFASDSTFAAAFGATQTNGIQPVALTAKFPPGFDSFGDVLQPYRKTTPEKKEPKKLIEKDLDTSMMQLAGNLSIKNSDQIKKTEHQWQPRSDSRLTGGSNWQQPMSSSSTWSTQPQFIQQPMMGGPRIPYGSAGMPGVGGPHMGMAPMNNMGMMPNTMGGVPMAMYNQPMMGSMNQPRPQIPQTQANDPFGLL